MKSKKASLPNIPLFLTLILTLPLVFGMTSQGLAAEIEHHYQSHDALITKSCSNGNWEPVTEYQIDSSNFTAGKKYLIVINFSINTSNIDANAMARVLHDDTEFSDSRHRNESRFSGGTHCGHAYNYWTVWEAVSGEDINIEVTQPFSSSYSVYTEEYEAFVINLSDDLTENTDWFYATATHSGDLPYSWGTAPGIGASITIDYNGSSDWLVLALGHFLSDDITYRYLMRIYDETAGLSYSLIKIVQEDPNDERPHMIMTGLTNITQNHTVRVEAAQQGGGPHDWDYSKIFALNLNKFKDHWTGYSTTGVQLDQLDTWIEVYSKLDYSSSQAGNALIWSQEVADVGDYKKAIYSRMILNSSVVPANHEDAKRELPHGHHDEDAHHRIYLGSVNEGSNDIVIEMNEDRNVDPTIPVIDIHSLSIFSMELFPCPTPQTPHTPVPSNGATGLSLDTDLNWGDCTDADVYEVYFDTVNPPVTRIADGLSSSEYALDPLEYNKPYYWRIVAQNKCGNSTEGPVWTFTTCCPPSPDPPDTPTPSNGAIDVDIDDDLDWADSAYAVSYDVYFGTVADPDPPWLASGVTSSDYTLDTLACDTEYFWKIVAKNSCGHPTDGPVWNFTTEFVPAPDVPNTPVPSDGAGDVDRNADLNWADSAYAVSYDVYFGTVADPDPPLVASGITSSDYTLEILDCNTQFFWKIVATNKCGDTTPGPVWDFTTEYIPIPGAPASPAPSDGAPSASIDSDLNWADSSNAQSYDVYFGTSSTPPLVAEDITDSEYTLDTLVPNTPYYWQIEAKNKCYTTLGSLWSFTTESCPIIPGTPASPSPANDATDESAHVVLDWSDCTKTHSYDVYFGTSESPPIYAEDITESTYTIPVEVDDYTDYYWMVRAKNDCGDYADGPVWHFETGHGIIHYVDNVNGWNVGRSPFTDKSLPAYSIGSAIDACTDGRVYVRNTGKKYSQQVFMKSDVDVMGRDENWDEPTASDYSDCPHVSASGPVVTFEGPVSNCTLEWFKLTGGDQGTGAPGQMVFIGADMASAVTDVTVTNCLLLDATQIMVALLGYVSFTMESCDLDHRHGALALFATAEFGAHGSWQEIFGTGSPIVLRDCKVHESGRAGILLNCGDGNCEIIIEDTDVYENRRAGIYLHNFASVTIDDGNIYSNGYLWEGNPAGGAGIYLEDVASATIRRNTINDNVRAGIAINGNGVSQTMTIGGDLAPDGSLGDGNTIHGNYAGVSFGGGKSPTQITGTYLVKGNNIYGHRRGGVWVRRKINGTATITQNDIHNNGRGGIGIKKDCELIITKNNIRNHSRGGIHTGGAAGSFGGTDGGAVLTIRQNKIHHNGGSVTGAGIDVRPASGTIENNLVYRNKRAGIRYGDWSDGIFHNTVSHCGNDYDTLDSSDDRGGGIVYDDDQGSVNDPPSGAPSESFPIKNNISAYNVRAGIRACFYETEDINGDKYRDYNLLYSNNQAFLSDWCGICASPDCSTGDRRQLRKCRGAQLGRGCDGTSTFCCTAIGATGALPGETLIFAQPQFESILEGSEDYHLKGTSPAQGAGDCNGSPCDMGAYGGDHFIVDEEIPQF